MRMNEKPGGGIILFLCLFLFCLERRRRFKLLGWFILALNISLRLVLLEWFTGRAREDLHAYNENGHLLALNLPSDLRSRLRLRLAGAWKFIWEWSMFVTDAIVLWLLSRNSPVSAHTASKRDKKSKSMSGWEKKKAKQDGWSILGSST